jgi:hypothetical protein
MTESPLPEMRCAPLPRFDLDDWPAIHRLFAGLPAWKLKQEWLVRPSVGLRPGFCSMGTWADALVVYAALQDEDIFNPVHEFNEVAFTRGDAFEMFLRPQGQDAYYEFHVTPHNQRLQLRFESATAFRSLPRKPDKQALDACKVHGSLFDSRTQITIEQSAWYVVAVIPFASVVETPEAAGRMRWRFSASRYDYTRGRARPVLSSTSPHTMCDFHRQQEWGGLTLSPPFAASVAGRQTAAEIVS